LLVQADAPAADEPAVFNAPAQPAEPIREAPAVAAQPSTGGVRHMLRGLGGLAAQLETGLRERLLASPLGRSEPVRPADVQRQLETAMLAPENILEDARYRSIVPNDYVVELHPDTYAGQFQRIEQHVCQQWRERLLEALNTANQRLGRRQYQFGGPVAVSMQAAAEVAPSAVRVRARIAPAARSEPARACLELTANGRRWNLPPGTTLLGRDDSCDIRLEGVNRAFAALISGQHAYLSVSNGAVRLFDGSPAGRPSLNGTAVNGEHVPAAGRVLVDGDVVSLAPPAPNDPAPGAEVTFVFHAACPDD
jgi:hypothetical protein